MLAAEAEGQGRHAQYVDFYLREQPQLARYHATQAVSLKLPAHAAVAVVCSMRKTGNSGPGAKWDA